MSNAISGLTCRRVHKSFDGVRVLADVTLRVSSDGVTALIGPNGAGKTTLLNILTGFVRADEGQCFLGDRETTTLPSYRIAQLGVARTFQDLRLIRAVSTLENVLLARPTQRGENLLHALLPIGLGTEEAHNREVAEECLDYVGLLGKASLPAGELSYGQQKLLVLACALAMEAEFLLLDEPVAGVHPDMAARILLLLRELRDAGKSILFIEHDISAVRQISDHVIVMDQGRVIAQGPPGDVLNRPEIMEAYIG